MPLPAPKAEESQDDFISRCMSNDTMQEEYSDHEQRVAVCFSQWQDKKKEAEDDTEGHQCVCPECGHVMEVELGEKCKEQECSECGTRMIQKTSGVKEAHLYTYKEQDEEGKWQDRWIAVSTDEIWDSQGEMFTKEAMDYDIAKAVETGEYPELRLFHVRGFKIGECDSMKRVGKYAVDQGSWDDTPFAQAVKDLVQENPGKWKISRGFHMVEASGLCPECGVGLTVRPLNLIVGVPCSACGTWAAPSKVKQLRHLKTRTFDITITDVPAVGTTGVAAYSVRKDGGIHE